MSPTLIAYTDFSHISENTRNYACKLAEKSGYNLLLFHNFMLPLSYMAEGLAMYTFNESFKKAEEELALELEWIHENYPAINVQTEISQGRFTEMVGDISARYNVKCLIIGSPQDQDDYFSLDGDFIETLLGIRMPVLVIPAHVIFSRINNVGLACDYRNKYAPVVLETIREMEYITHARLHVIHIDNHKKPVNENNRNELESALQPFYPEYVNIESQDFASAIIGYAREKEIDMLIVIPQKHGFLDYFFRQRSISRLAKINQIPILTLPDLR